MARIGAGRRTRRLARRPPLRHLGAPAPASGFTGCRSRGLNPSARPLGLLMKLQRAGVPAGVCQNAEDRVDTDPRLKHLKWLTEVTGTKIGTWPIYEIADEIERDPGLYRRPHQPGRALLRRGQYVGADRAARPNPE